MLFLNVHKVAIAKSICIVTDPSTFEMFVDGNFIAEENMCECLRHRRRL